MTSNFDEMTLEAIWNEIDVRLKEKPELYKDMNTTYSINYPVKMEASSA